MKSMQYRLTMTMIMSTAALAISILSQSTLAEETCGDYGTAVAFVDSPAAAAKQALKEEKLVFVLHVSGNFEVSEYT